MKSLTSFFPDCDEAEKKGKDKWIEKKQTQS
jgi:hypothetical protein